MQIMTDREKEVYFGDTKTTDFRVPLPLHSVEFIAEGMSPIFRTGIYHCHAFVKVLGEFLELKYARGTKSINLLEESEKIASKLIKAKQSKKIRSFFDDYLKIDELATQEPPRIKKEDHSMILSELLQSLGRSLTPSGRKDLLNSKKEEVIELATKLQKYTAFDIMTFYFGKMHEYELERILQARIPYEWRAQTDPTRLTVADVSSIKEGSRTVAINALLTAEWEIAKAAWQYELGEFHDKDTRVPTFIVVDEAHNLIPARSLNSREALILENFRKVVAEGRKYGLFLIIVSQRPDKVDPLILSECENRAIMRISSESVLRTAQDIMNVDNVPQRKFNKCLDLNPGRALFHGRWSSVEGEFVYIAARRTLEGGRNLRPEHWAVPP